MQTHGAPRVENGEILLEILGVLLVLAYFYIVKKSLIELYQDGYHAYDTVHVSTLILA